MYLQKTITQLQKEINFRLEIFFERKIKEIKKISPLAGKMVGELRDFVLRNGKRIRPIFLYYGYFTSGGKNKKAILDASLSIELIHNYLLIHDDIIDQDELRRGKPTIHCLYREIYYKIPKRAEHLGVSAGIVAGDLLSSFGYEILANSKFPQPLKIKAIGKLNQILVDVMSGEILDVFLNLEKKLSKEEIFKILEYKTARYTIEGPLHLGAILAGADQRTLKILSDYAVPLGIAFQIRDDILGIFGNEKKTGKPVGSDLREGKQTLLILKARELATKTQRQIIEKALGNPNLTKKQMEKVRKIIIETGSFDFVQNLARDLAAQSKIAVRKSSFPSQAKEFLLAIADYLVEREK